MTDHRADEPVATGRSHGTAPRTPCVLNKTRDRIPPDAIFCGRPSPFGNPFVVGRDGTRDQVVDAYAEWIQGQPALLAQLPDWPGATSSASTPCGAATATC